MFWQLVFAFLNHYENVIRLDEHFEDSLGLLNSEILLENKLALHVICSKFTLTQVTLTVKNNTFTLASIIRPITIINLLNTCVEHATTTIALAIKVITIVNIAGYMVKHAASPRLLIVFPATFVDRAIQVDYLTVAFSCESLMLAHVDVAVCVQQLAHAVTVAIFELALEYDA
jgi:hypothetical protein